jgi:hypothetical protein
MFSGNNWGWYVSREFPGHLGRREKRIAARYGAEVWNLRHRKCQCGAGHAPWKCLSHVFFVRSRNVSVEEIVEAISK